MIVLKFAKFYIIFIIGYIKYKISIYFINYIQLVIIILEYLDRPIIATFF